MPSFGSFPIREMLCMERIFPTGNRGNLRRVLERGDVEDTSGCSVFAIENRHRPPVLRSEKGTKRTTGYTRCSDLLLVMIQLGINHDWEVLATPINIRILYF